MQFIDINCMIGEWGHGDLRFKTSQQLSKEMDRLDIVKAFVFDSRAWLYDPKFGNEILIKNTEDSQNIIPVMVITPLIEQEFGGRDAVINYIKKNKVGAVRLYPIDHNFTLNIWNIEKLFSIMNEISMPVIFDCRGFWGGLDQYYNEIYEIAHLFIDTPIILTTIGYRSLRIIYELFDKCPNIYIDTSTFITYRGIEDTVKHFGSEKILFGSRMPFIEGGVSLGRIIYADITTKERENIAYKNAIRILDGNKLFNRGGHTA